MRKKIKILQILPSLAQANGISAYVCNYFNMMDKNNIDMSFLLLVDDDKSRFESVLKNNGKIYELYKNVNIFDYFKKIDDFFKNNHFDIVHCHVPNYGVFFLYFAKKYNVKVRILHSHVNKSSDKKLNQIRNDIISPVAVRLANEYFACSNLAGDFLFSKKDYFVINNAINFENYKFDSFKRNEIRNSLNLNGKFVIGEFGRLNPQKNPLFTLEIFNEVLKVKSNAFLILVGDGELYDKVVTKIEEYNLNDKVLLLGNRNDVNDLYNCLDVFLLPSTYEGLGIVLIEAQANGLPCFTSKDLVPKAAAVSDLVTFVELNDNASEWAKLICDCNSIKRVDVTKNIVEKGYDINSECNKLTDLYMQLYLKHRSD